jgi:hypothetical protein
VENVVLKLLSKRSFSLFKSTLLFFISKIICAIIAYTLFVFSYCLAVLDPALLYIEYVKYLGYLVGSVVLKVAAGLGVAANLGVAVTVAVYCSSCLVIL